MYTMLSLKGLFYLWEGANLTISSKSGFFGQTETGHRNIHVTDRETLLLTRARDKDKKFVRKFFLVLDYMYIST